MLNLLVVRTVRVGALACLVSLISACGGGGGGGGTPPSPAINVSKTTITTGEDGTADSFTVVLNTQPTADVMVPIVSSDTTEGSVDVALLTFTNANWNIAQTVNVTGQNDAIDDGDVAYIVEIQAATSTDTNYSGRDAADVAATNTDDADTAGILLGAVGADPIAETGGSTGFTVVLTSEPTSDVSVDLSSSNAATGATVTPAQITFTPLNWNTPVPATITAVADVIDEVDELITATVTVNGGTVDPVYTALAPSSVTTNVTDDDIAGVTVGMLSLSTISETGGTATFSVTLTTQPTSDVLVNVASSNSGQATVSSGQLTFTAGNWNTPQIVTVSAVDDPDIDGTVGVNILLTIDGATADSFYAVLDPADHSLSVTDNDVAGINVTPTSGLTTTEAGGTANFAVVLTSRPVADVTVTLSSSDTTEGTISPSSLTFTAANWNNTGLHTVTITGQNDNLDDGDQAYTINTAASTSADPNYGGAGSIDPADVSVTNTDDDSSGITVSPVSGLTTTEAGGTATFTVVLDAEPTTGVSINLTSSDTGEGTVSPGSVSFTTGDWNVAQTVTVTGVNDDLSDGNQTYSIVTAAAVSPGEASEVSYNGMNASDVSVTNSDDDTAGVTVTPTTGLVTTEAGGTADFTVVLNTQPDGTVTIPLTSDDGTEGTPSVASVSFDDTNWNIAQTVTVTGVDDGYDDGDVIYHINTGTITGTDTTGYLLVSADDVQLSNTDDDTAGVTVNVTPPLTTTEGGGTASFNIVLTSQPMNDVTLTVTSNNTAEGLVSGGSSPTPVDVITLTFTDADWDQPHTVTITGQNDDVDDGDVAYTLAISNTSSADPVYSGRAPSASSVNVTNTDNDSSAIFVTPDNGLTTTEAGGTDTFTIVLGSQPTGDVSIDLSSSNTAEGTVSPSTVVFTSGNWNTPQLVTVTGVDDDVDDGDVAYTIVTAPAVSATDTNYNGLNPADVSVSNTDNDAVGITLGALTPSGTFSENGGSATFTVVLDSRPSGNVLVNVQSSDTTEANVDTVQLVFTSGNWNAPQTVTVTSVNDAVDDGDQGVTIQLTMDGATADTAYQALDPADPVVTVTDDDTAGVTVGAISASSIPETGGSATFNVVLDSEPAGNVVIDVASSDGTAATVSTNQLTFTTGNWNVAQTVTVNAVSDAVDDGDQVANILLTMNVGSTADSLYDVIDPADPSVTVIDDDTVGITVNPTSGLTTTEAGGTDTFTIVLTSQPAFDVTVGVSSLDGSEASVSPASVTFTSANWNVAQTVTVTGLDDFIIDGNQNITIQTAAAVSTDTAYNGINPADVGVTNSDNDTAGFTVTPTSGLSLGENGGTDTFTVVLNAQPSADVVIGVTSQDESEAIASPASLTFTTANWNVAQTVTLTGQNDDIDDGNQVINISTAAAVSSDTNYSGLNPDDVSATVTDDDTANITVGALMPAATTTEAGGSATFTVVLNTQPTADVTVPVASSNTNEGTVSPAPLTFTTANWNVAQTVTVTGVDDFLDDGDQVYTINIGPSVSADLNYNGIDPTDPSVTNTDNDAVGISVTPTSGLTTSESGTTASFTVVLDSQPGADVTIDVEASDTTETLVSGGDSPGVPTSLITLTFTSTDWQTPQTVTITGQNDDVADGNQLVTITTANSVSTDSGYNGINPADVTVTNNDNDAAGITVTPTSGLTTTEAGGTDTFTVVLNSQPTANVTIGVSAADSTETLIRGGDSPVTPTTSITLTFTPSDWNTAQTVTVVGQDDAIDDGNQSVSITTAAASSTDTNYNGVDPSDVSVTNNDDDAAGVTVGTVSSATLSENGGSATFTVVLNTQPTGDVVINVGSSDPGEATPSPTQLTFTSVSWANPQVVTINGVNDAIDDGDQPVTIQVTMDGSTADGVYGALDPADPAVTVTDDDTAGVTVSALTPSASINENGGAATFTVVLNSQPTGDVVIDVASGDTGEATVSPTPLTFTASDWMTAQTVTVTGVMDGVTDGDQLVPITVTMNTVSTADGAYDLVDPADTAVTVVDFNIPNIIVTPANTDFAVDEEIGGIGTSRDFTVVLNTLPTATVTITMTSPDITEVLLMGGSSPATPVASITLTFTTSDWMTPQTVTVQSVNDAVADGNQQVTIATDPAVSADGDYNGMDIYDPVVTVFDNQADQYDLVVSISSVVNNMDDTATVTYVVTNNGPETVFYTGVGAIPVLAVDVWAHRATPPTPGDFDTPNTYVLTGSLASGASTLPQVVVVPLGGLTTGTAYALVDRDGSLAETFENNNVSSGFAW